jgi:hypothetical protein
MSDELIAFASRVTDCEWKAAHRYDDGHSSISELAQRVMGICTVERLEMRKAFKVPLNDPEIESVEFKQAIKNVEHAREIRAKEHAPAAKR